MPLFTQVCKSLKHFPKYPFVFNRDHKYPIICISSAIKGDFYVFFKIIFIRSSL